jgi:hypothetical protein
LVTLVSQKKWRNLCCAVFLNKNLKQKNMNTRNTTSEKILLGLSIFAPLFLFLIHLNHTVFKSRFVLIGVVQEMFTIPCILGQPLLLTLAIIGLYKRKFKEPKYAYVSIVILVIGISLTVANFIVSQSN